MRRVHNVLIVAFFWVGGWFWKVIHADRTTANYLGSRVDLTNPLWINRQMQLTYWFKKTSPVVFKKIYQWYLERRSICVKMFCVFASFDANYTAYPKSCDSQSWFLLNWLMAKFRFRKTRTLNAVSRFYMLHLFQSIASSLLVNIVSKQLNSSKFYTKTY